MAAITGLLLLINRQTAGFLEATLIFLFPLPMVFFSAKYGMRDSWMVFAAICLLAMMISTPQSIFYVATESLIGLVYGSGIYNHTDSVKLVIRTMIMAAVADLLSMVVFASFFGYDVMAEIAEVSNVISDTYGKAGVALPDSMDLTAFVKNIFVVSAALTGIFEGFITHVASRLMLSRMRIYTAKMTPFTEYFPAKWSGYAAMAGTAVYVYTTIRPFENEILQSFLQTMGMACFFYLAIFCFVGILAMWKLRNPKASALIIIPALMVTLMGSYLAGIIGFLYITTDLHERALKAYKGEKTL